MLRRKVENKMKNWEHSVEFQQSTNRPLRKTERENGGHYQKSQSK